MDVDDVLGSAVAVAAATAAALFSPPVRALVRRGAVGGLAGLLTAADLVRAAVQVVGPGAERPPSWAASGLQDITDRPQGTGDPGASGTPEG